MISLKIFEIRRIDYLENTLILKRDNGSIKKLNSIIIFLVILYFSGFSIYTFSPNKLILETLILLLVIYLLAIFFSILKGKINSKSNAPFILKCDGEYVVYYPLIKNRIVYRISLRDIKDIHVLWWGNGTNKITINFYQKPQFSTRIENEQENMIEKNVLYFERMDVSLKDFNNFFNSMNAKYSCSVIFDKR